MLSKTIRLINTIKFLKPIQIRYRLYYVVRKKFRELVKKRVYFFKPSNSTPLNLIESIHIIDTYRGDNRFIFLNLEKSFKNSIDWNFSEYGKLWTYNLTYFDYLSQNNRESNIRLMHDFIDNIESIKDGLEPFPISLRGINWIKFLAYSNIKSKKIDNSLYAQYSILLENVEYHLLGNHLLENGFSLLFGAYYFQDELLYKKAKEILTQELEEQILEDGGHFELSPMYHQIMLFRLLDAINLLQNNSWKERELLNFLVNKSQLMLGWLNNISYKNGDIPLFNDSTKGIAPTTNQLFNYAQRLQLQEQKSSLSQSGYRKIVKEKYEAIVDVGNITASYIAGHTHADIFNFELRIDNRPFIVDRGLSTYESNKQRRLERSTFSHNTVEVNEKNQSEVWGGFRVANRAEIIYLKEESNFIEATHNGYGKDRVLHTRKWSFFKDKIVIEDSLSQSANGVARFYFAPTLSKEDILASFHTDKKIEFKEYDYCLGFNKFLKGISIHIHFKRFLAVEFKI